jgi:hypothetical protein
VADNDTGIKQAIETQIAGIQTQISGVDQTYQSAGIALEGRLTAASSALETRLAATEGSASRVSTLELSSALLTRDLVNMSDGLKAKMAEIDQALLTKGTDYTSRDKKGFEGKPLMEYKMIGDLGDLQATNRHSGAGKSRQKTYC